MASDDSSPAELKPLGVNVPSSSLPPLPGRSPRRCTVLTGAGVGGVGGGDDCELNCTNTVLIENCPSLAFNLLCHLNLQEAKFVLMNFVSF